MGLVLLQIKMRTPPTNTKIRTQTRIPAIRAASVRDKHQSEEASIQCEWMSTEAFPPTTELYPAESWVGPGGSERCTWVCSRFGQCFPALCVSGGCTVSYCLFVTLTSCLETKQNFFNETGAYSAWMQCEHRAEEDETLFVKIKLVHKLKWKSNKNSNKMTRASKTANIS